MPTIKIPSLHGGVSRQPAQVRFPEQLEESLNIRHSVVNGAGKRAGTTLERVMSGCDGTERLHPIDRRTSEQWLLLYRAGSIRAVPASSSGTEAVVHKLSKSRLYLGTATADQLRLLTVSDTTIISNNQVATGTVDQDALASALELPTASDIFSHTPAAGTIYRAKTDDVVGSAGYWQYSPGGNTYATLQFPTTYNAFWGRAGVAGGWADQNNNPSGFRIFFGRFVVVTASAAWTAATKTITKAGAFTSYTHQAGDYLNITVGGTPGWYKIARRISSAAVELDDASFSAIDVATLSIDGIGTPCNVSIDLNGEAAADMHDIAAVVERSMQAVTGLQALCGWVSLNSGSAVGGYMVVTSPYNGKNAHFPATQAVLAPASGLFDLTIVGIPFDKTSAVVVGGAGSLECVPVPIETRWEQIAVPSQEGAMLDKGKLPQQIQRLHNGGVIDWSDFTTALRPMFGWRLDDASTSSYAIGTYGALNGQYVTAVPGYTGPSAITDSHAVQIGVSGAVKLGKLTGWGRSLADGFTIETALLSAAAARATIFSHGYATSGGGVELQLQFHTNNGSTLTANALWFHLSDSNGNKLVGYTTSPATLTGGAWHHIVVAVNPSLNSLSIWVDGAVQNVTLTSSSGPVAFTDQKDNEPAAIGGWYAAGSTTPSACATNSQFSEFYLHPSVFTAEVVAMRYGRFANASYAAPSLFVVAPIDWTPRYSGDSTINPAPFFIREEKPVDALAFGSERFLMGGGPGIGGSQSRDLFNFYASDGDNVSDADPLDLPIQDDAVAAVTDIVPLQKVMLILTTSPLQMELAFDGPSSSQRVSLTPTTRYRTLDVRPAAMNTAVYYAISRPKGAHLIEVLYDGSAAQMNPYDITEHADGYVPATLKSLRAHNNTQTLFALSTDGAGLYVYRSFWANNKKEQSAWNQWTIAGGCTIVDTALVADALWVLVKQGSLYTLESLPVEPGAVVSGWPFTLHLDRQMTLTGGSYNAGTGRTTWTMPVSDSTIDAVYVGSSYVNVGARLTPTVVGSSISVAGDYHTGSVVAGRTFTMRGKLSRQFMRDQNGASILNMRVTHRETVVRHAEAGSYTLIGAMDNRADRYKQFTAPDATVAGDGQIVAFINGDSEALTFTLESTDGRPCTWSSLEMTVDADARSPE